MLLWLADHGAPAVAEAAATIADIVGATRRLGAEEQAVLDTVPDALGLPLAASGPIELPVGGLRAGNGLTDLP